MRNKANCVMDPKSFWKFNIIAPFIRDHGSEERTYLVLSLVTGIAAALVAVFIKWSTNTLTSFFGTNQQFGLSAILYGMAALLIGSYVTKHFPSTAGSGIPRVKIALAVFQGKIPFLDTVAKLITSILSLSTGLSLGREGPTVAVASGVGSALGEFFHLSKKRVKNLVAIGAAGGLAAAFNTPIAAVTFTLEEIIGDLNAKILGSVIVSSVAASVTALLLIGDEPTFSELHYRLNDVNELFIYFFVGIAAAVVGPIWVRLVMKMRHFNRIIFGKLPILLVMLTFAIIIMVSYINTDALGSGHHTIEKTLHALITDWKILLVLFILKFALTIICYASGLSGGLFMPTLLNGALLGGLIGALAQLIFPSLVISIGPYALVGMGAYFAAVLRTPITSIIMIFEMTRDYRIMLPLMIANITAFTLARYFLKGSVYVNISQQDGVYLPGHDDHEVMETLLIEDAMVKEVQCLNAKISMKEAHQIVQNTDITGFPVMHNGRLIGMINKSAIISACARQDFEKLVEDIAEKTLVKIYPDQTLMDAFHRLKKFNVSRLPVVSRLDTYQLIGIITAEDIVNKFGYHIQEERGEIIEEPISSPGKA